jgi:non-specific serine/threonine protein kinase
MNITLLERYSAKIDPSIRQKGARILAAKKLKTVDSDETGCLVRVSSETDPQRNYTVRIMEANGMLTASCNCPYYTEHGPCKHISSVVSHLIIEQATQGKSLALSERNAFDPSHTSFPYEPITQEFVRKNSTEQYLLDANKVVEKQHSKALAVKEKWRGHVFCEVQDVDNYWKNFQVKIELGEKNILFLSCNCKNSKAALCSHKVTALRVLSKDYTIPDFLQKLPLKEHLLDEALKPFGFTSLDPQIEKLFRMEIDLEGDYVAIPIQKGIIRTSSYASSYKGMIKMTQQIGLPIELNEEEEKARPESSYAYLFCPSELRNGLGYLPSFYTLVGTLNKEGTELAKNISHRSEAYEKGHVLPMPTENQRAIEEVAILLQEKNISKYAKKLADSPESTISLVLYVLDKLQALKALIGHEILYFSDSEYFGKNSLQRLSLSSESPQIEFKVYLDPPFLCLEGTILLQGKPLPYLSLDEYSFYFIKRDDTLFFFQNAADILHIQHFRENPILRVHQSDEPSFLKEYVLPLTKNYEVSMQLSKPVQKEAATGFKPSIYLSEQGNFLLVRPVVTYEQGEVDLLSDEILLKDQDTYYAEFERDVPAETSLKEFLTSFHPEFPKQVPRGFFYVHFNKLFEQEWYFKFFQGLKEAQIEVFGLEKIQKARYSPYKPSIKSRLHSGIDWFDAKIDISFGEQSVSLRDVQKALFRKENYVRLGDGTLGLLPEEWLEKHGALLRTGEVGKNGELKVSKFHFTLLDELLGDIDNEDILQEIEEKKEKLMLFEGIQQHPVPDAIQAKFRPYQTAGYQWLMFLDEFGWGGCLADDMGLGKTLQIIAFLQKQIELHPGKPNLVVLPTTLLFNWKKELQKFAPHLSYLDYTGGQRTKQRAHFQEYNIVLTTYGLVVNDIEKLRKAHFNYIILDESQAIKNPESQRYKAVCLLGARNKIVMTGTPVENNTFDLFAQMNFVNPGLLGTMAHFQAQFSTPIDKFADKEAADILRKIISPFLLRRTKDQVAQELPDKTEDVIICEMGAEQRKVYNAFRDNYRQMIVGSIEKEGLGKSSMMVLDALLKLRQICNSPALLNTQEDFGSASIKTEELMAHLTEKTGQHKVLVFSQFTQMLKLLEKELQNQGMEYEYLDGQTPSKQREEKVNRFQTEPSVRVFLISLKAGGVGLNLTEADYVYLIDPWWNPAVEAQAIDRTHRIGQLRKVFAYRMICKDTIEEKVLQLQERKRKVAQDLISTESAFYKQLDKEDIVELFS